MKEWLSPVAGKVVVEPLDDFETPAGLILPDSAKRPHSGRVLAIGPLVLENLQGFTGQGPKLVVGGTIVFNYMAGASFTLKDSERPYGYHVELLDWKDILAVVEKTLCRPDPKPSAAISMPPLAMPGSSVTTSITKADCR